MRIADIWEGKPRGLEKEKTYALAGILFGCGLVMGAAAAVLISQSLADRPQLTAREALAQVKDSLQSQGTIEGSWVEMEPVQTVRFGQEQTVYYGGVSL